MADPELVDLLLRYYAFMAQFLIYTALVRIRFVDFLSLLTLPGG